MEGGTLKKKMFAVHHNEKAKNVIRKVLKENSQLQETILDFMHVSQWINESRPVKCYTIQDKVTGKVVSFILLSKMYYDPFKEQSRPFMLHFVYTVNEFRRQNFAYKLLIHIKDHEETTAFCSRSESEELFKKGGFGYYGYHGGVATYRFMKV